MTSAATLRLVLASAIMGSAITDVSAAPAAACGALKSQDVVTGLNRLGMDALGGTPEDFSDFIASEIKKTTIVAVAAGLKK